MRKVSAQNDPTTLVEAYFQYPPEFKDTYSGFVDLCVRTDNLFAKLFADEQYDVIVADATSGYRLSTYFEYGGHQREFTQVGDEIHAETSRLFMRFKGRGAIRIRVENAYATHSVRKIIKDPLLEMATAGFPREEAWYKRWREQLSSPSSLNELMMNTSHPNVAQAMNLRVRHAIGIFAILPTHFFRALGKTLSTSGSEKLFVEDLAKLLPRRTADDAKNVPATLLTDVFSLIDNMGEEINKKANEAIGCNGVFSLFI
ncbi:MAG: hypothetical protein IPJ94_17670 [Chloroflexi bacterium]|nr:hypothetical protein [Chloroflexota bacterium]